MPPTPPSVSTSPAAPCYVAVDDSDELAAIVRLEAINASLLVMAKARDLIAFRELPPQALRTTFAALGDSLDRLERLGLPLGDVDIGAPVMKIVEMSAKREAEIRAQASAEFHGMFQLDDDEFDPEPGQPFTDEPSAAEPLDLDLPPDDADDDDLPDEPLPPSAELRQRLAAGGERFGRAWLRTLAVAHDLPVSQSQAELTATLSDAAAADPVIHAALEAELARRAV